MIVFGHELPEPLREAPDIGSGYFMPEPSWGTGFIHRYWCDSSYERQYLAHGFVHGAEENAIAWSEFWLKQARGELG